MIQKENFFVDKNITTTPLNGISQKIGNTSIKEVLFEIFVFQYQKIWKETRLKS